uniref:Galactosylxylosylprotein 3-beta-galactosyltransferase n=1 Tax=Tetraselmis sp. GSL018 TaxID=582737 RepID=A0A061R181_9CHLO
MRLPSSLNIRRAGVVFAISLVLCILFYLLASDATKHGSIKCNCSHKNLWEGEVLLFSRRKTTCLPRQSLDQVHYPQQGSMFGNLFVQLDCPSLTKQGIYQSTVSSYVPSTLFPLSRIAGRERQLGSSNGLAATLTLLVGILSTCDAIKQRMAARTTWMRFAAPEGAAWKAVFLLGSQCQNHLQREQEKFGDLHFLPVEESYYTLTPKVLGFFEYAERVGAQYALKTDDDTFVFVDRILAELERMPEACLYWGGSEKLPELHQYRGSGIDVPLNKWYISEDDFNVLAGTRYMAGGAYVLSKDLVRKVNENVRWLDLPRNLPEDAVVGRLLGSAEYAACHCSDTRVLKHITDFQGAQLFHPSVYPCERADISRRVLSIHGMKNTNHAYEVFRYATQPHELECSVGERVYSGFSAAKFWGRALPRESLAINPIEKTSHLHQRLRSLKPDPWRRRNDFVPYDAPAAAAGPPTAERTPAGNASGPELVPLRAVLRGAAGEGRPGGRGRVPLPWCVRLLWISQAMEILARLSRMRTLLCDIDLNSFFVEPRTAELRLDRGFLPVRYANDTRHHGGSFCFRDAQCHACFGGAARQWLPAARCNTTAGRCVGFDAASQVQVVLNSVIGPLAVPGWSKIGRERSKSGQRDFELEIESMKDRFVSFDHRGPPTAADALTQNASLMIQDAVRGAECRDCIRRSVPSLVQALESLMGKPPGS